jgi:hypothetical protein
MHGRVDMRTMEIEWGDWLDFIAELSVRYEGWTAIVERIGGQRTGEGANGLSSYVESTLDHVFADVDGGQERLVFSFGDARHLVIERPTGLALEETGEGEDDILEIEAESGTTRVRLRVPEERAGPD